MSQTSRPETIAKESLTHLQDAINLLLHTTTEAGALKCAARSWADLHGQPPELADLASQIQQELEDVQEHLIRAEDRLYDIALLRQPGEKFRIEKAREGLALLVDINSALTALESTLSVESSPSADSRVVAERLIAISRRKVFAAMAAIRSLKIATQEREDAVASQDD